MKLYQTYKHNDTRQRDKYRILCYAFYGCSGHKNITYKGTIADWKNIAKGSWWNETISTDCIIHCTDGDIKISY